MKKLWAAIDLGTNSCLLLLCEENADGELLEVREESHIVRLGESLEETGRLSDAAIERTFDALDHHLSLIPLDRSTGLGVAAATSAVRDAENGAEFLDAIAERLGGDRPHLFDGRQEAETTFLGAASEAAPERFVVCIDVGGGSTEIAAGTPGDCRFAASLDIGCVRCGERFDLLDRASPCSLDALRCEVRKHVEPVAQAIADLAPASDSVLALASAGTATTLAAYEQKIQGYDRQRVHGFKADLDTIDRAIANLAFLNAARRAEFPGIRPGRAPVFPAGLVILGETLSVLGLHEFTITTRALRYGMALRLQRGGLSPTFEW